MANKPPYKPLPTPTSIRLLKIEAGQKSDPIRCTFKIADLKEVPIFEALSYCWGTDGRIEVVECDGAEVMITPNLADALRRFRPLPESELEPRFGSLAVEPDAKLSNGNSLLRLSNPNDPKCHRFCGWLWADAICINQDDDVERSRQVVMMGDIYSKAKTVLVWLGTSGDDDRLMKAFVMLEACVKEYDRKYHRLSNMVEGENILPNEHYQNILIGANASYWDAVSWFISLPWFGRLWVIQEVALAQVVQTFIGDHEISAFKELGNAGFWLLESTHRLQTKDIYHLFFLGNNSCSISHQWRTSLYDLLERTENFACTEPEDRVYAILGIAEDNQDAKVRITLTASYSRPFHEVYRDAARVIVERSGEIDILNSGRPSLAVTEGMWPSWAPDWRSSRNAHSFLNIRFGEAFRATEKITAVIEHAIDERQLRVEGFEGDSVIECIAFPDDDFLGVFQTIPKIWSRVRQRLDCRLGRHSNIDLLSTAFTNTLIAADKEFSERTEFSTEVSLFQKKWLDEGLSASPLPESGIKRPPEKTEFSRLDDQIWMVCKGRCFFITEGGYMGIGDKVAKVNDIVVVLLGGKTPYIVREQAIPEPEDQPPCESTPDGISCRFMGACYVDGLMYGEMLENNDRKEIFYNIW